MQDQSPELRQRYADAISALAREWIVEREAAFDLDIQRGVQWCDNTATGDKTPLANSSLTLTLTINGGAQESEGPPIVPSPPVFREPRA